MFDPLTVSDIVIICKNWPICPPIYTHKMQSLSTCRRVLNEVVQKLKKYSKEGQKNFEDAVGEQAQSITVIL